MQKPAIYKRALDLREVSKEREVALLRLAVTKADEAVTKIHIRSVRSCAIPEKLWREIVGLVNRIRK